ncbi:glycerol-3-phosphate responsive antiterminator [uncultured Ilyobacter sp.]|jgi:glycerol uptake operon antiterminator|uniref:glycerol-3-phosphate responsive antiterminator n=1 Tax=uncultured Ilyobacter sp. TaxID=544433 RepID=UPI0029BFAFB4|nr:glycerol-3-phosphate responsive antiterminator [uncultured Ilyobacter sp.]
MSNFIKEILERNPVIPAIKDEKGFQKALMEESEIVFILTSNLFNIKGMVEELKEKGKIVFVHADLVEGLSHSTYALEYLIKNTALDGIISTKYNLIKTAKKLNVRVIQRFFLLDSISLENSLKYARETKPDAVEILPGLMPKIIKRLSNELNLPVIAGGLITDKEDIMNALGAGASGVSTTKTQLWDV